MTGTDHKPIDTSLCPLCGAPNRCAMAGCNKNPNEPCWCKAEQFPIKFLDQVPEDRKNKACICKQCLVGIKLDDA
jgi:hypothetical protein